MENYKIVVFDLETIWNIDELAREDRMFNIANYYGRTMKADINSIICFGWKVLDGPSGVVSAWDFEGDLNDDAAVCAFAYDLLHDADCVVTHNGKRFDWKFLQTRLLINGLPSLPKIPHVDTCILARKNLSLFSNRLKDLAAQFTPERKLDTGGKKLWTRVYKGDKKAMKEMAEYCEQDVITTEAVFKYLRQFSSNLPNINLIRGTTHSCPGCGSKNVQKNGKRVTKTAINQRYRCLDCGVSSYTTGEDKVLRAV